MMDENQNHSVHFIQPASNAELLSSESISALELFGQRNLTTQFIGPDRYPTSSLVANSTNVFGPVSYTRMRFLPLLNIARKSTTSNDEKPTTETKDDNEGKFLMATTRNQNENDDEDSQETLEIERAKFVQELMLATVQSENFQP